MHISSEFFAMLYFLASVFVFWSLVTGDTVHNNLCEKCECKVMPYYRESMYVVNCTSVGITVENVSLLEQLPDQTEVLVFKGNNVSELPVNIFGSEKNLTRLKVIDMTNNNIKEIKGKTFHHVPVVERLILDHNSLNLSSRPHPRVFSNFDSLRELHLTDAFLDNTSADLAEQLHTIFTNSNLNQLEKLHLEQNEIRSFADRKVFCDLKNLTDLYIGDNKLEALNFDIDCLPNLRFIDLQANEIERFTKKDFNTFDSFSRNNHTLGIDIHKNPLVCDCVANNLYSWLRETRVAVRNNSTIQCHYLRNPNHTIFLNDYHEPDCISRLDTPDTPVGISNETFEHKFVHYFFLTTSSILVLSLIYLSVKYSLVYCRHAVTPASKVHYIVIRNPDENREVHV